MSVNSVSFSPERFVFQQKEQSEDCIGCRCVKLFLKVIAAAAIGAVVGGLVGLCIGFILPGVLFGAAAGTMAYAAMYFTVCGQSKTVPRSDAILASLKTEFKANATVLKAISSAERVLANPQLSNVYENHKLHHDLTVITDEVRNKDSIKKNWEVYLKSLNGMKVHYPTGDVVALDFSREIGRLQGEVTKVKVEKITRSSPKLEQELDEVVDLEIECFGSYGKFPKSYIDETLKNPNNGLFVARDQSGKLLGFLWYVKESDGSTWIYDVGRRANACRLGIGEKLFEAFLKEHEVKKTPLSLCVRISNEAAIQLYEKFGFEKTGQGEYYEYPKEDRYVMKLNWQKYQKKAAA